MFELQNKRWQSSFDVYSFTQTTFLKRNLTVVCVAQFILGIITSAFLRETKRISLKPFSNHVQIVISLELFWRLLFNALRCKKMVSRLCTHSLLFETSYNFAKVAKHTITTWKLQLQFSLSCLIRFKNITEIVENAIVICQMHI